MFENLTTQQKRLLVFQNHPWVLRVAKENLEFESAVLSLAACTPCNLQALTEAFKKFAASRPWAWRDAVSYCRAHFIERGRFPFEIKESVRHGDDK
jgi:hypothetical protein